MASLPADAPSRRKRDTQPGGMRAALGCLSTSWSAASAVLVHPALIQSMPQAHRTRQLLLPRVQSSECATRNYELSPWLPTSRGTAQQPNTPLTLQQVTNVKATCPKAHSKCLERSGRLAFGITTRQALSPASPRLQLSPVSRARGTFCTPSRVHEFGVKLNHTKPTRALPESWCTPERVLF